MALDPVQRGLQRENLEKGCIPDPPLNHAVSWNPKQVTHSAPCDTYPEKSPQPAGV
jgi:hypothetical protein